MNYEAKFNSVALVLAARIKSLRKHLELTQVDFGKKVGLTQAQISLIENAKSNVEFITLIQIAFGLKIETIELFNSHSATEYLKPNKSKNLLLRIEREKLLFGEQLFKISSTKKISQNKLAVKISVDEGDLNRFFRGNHNIELINIVKLCVGLNVEIETLFDY